ncbi:MAG: hypothetical protein IPM40_13060, partial [Gammaproteobacteria bacterium]|nr:hypothetical protein [Gammaproteobacteria bacterium]
MLNLAVLVGVLARPRHPRPRHVFLILVLDIAALVLITHASGGINSGFAILLMVTVAAAAIFVPGQIAAGRGGRQPRGARGRHCAGASRRATRIVHAAARRPARHAALHQFAAVVQRLAARLRLSQQLATQKA